MKITDVRIRNIRLKLATPQSNNRWSWDSMDHMIVEMFTDEGIVALALGEESESTGSYSIGPGTWL